MPNLLPILIDRLITGADVFDVPFPLSGVGAAALDTAWELAGNTDDYRVWITVDELVEQPDGAAGLLRCHRDVLAFDDTTVRDDTGAWGLVVPNAYDTSRYDPAAQLDAWWLEAVQLGDDDWLVYPQSRSGLDHFATFTFVGDGPRSIEMQRGTVDPVIAEPGFWAQLLRRHRRRGAGTRSCKYQITWEDGTRRVECGSNACASQCDKRWHRHRRRFQVMSCVCAAEQ